MAKKPRGKISASGSDYAESHGLSMNNVRGLTDGDIAGIEVVEDHTREILAALSSELGRALEEVGLVAEGYAKKLCPVDTGRLRNSITHTISNERGDWAAYIGTNVEYAESVEFNEKAKHTNGQAHYLRDAATTHADKYRAIIESHLKGN